ncbi:MAG TPA: choice-of-anchor tandem repeat GloVer-containing protein, partial [Nevskia sp.]|nr:choice-of-anchor tandem repeat GloVer-containing protein [Nevskia sp.]
SFGSASGDGANPEAGLVQGSDGKFYGTTASRGASGKGTAFQISSAGVLTTLYSFGSSPADGSGPTASLAAAPGLVFYGTSYSGGDNGTGTVYRLTVTPTPGPGGGGGAFYWPTLLALCAGYAVRRRRAAKARSEKRSETLVWR